MSTIAEIKKRAEGGAKSYDFNCNAALNDINELLDRLEAAEKVVVYAREVLNTVKLIQEQSPGEIFKDVFAGYFCFSEDVKLADALAAYDKARGDK